MKTCKICGELIEFKTIDGKPRPMHIDGEGCRGYETKSEQIDRYTLEDLTIKRNCPKCKKPVFFIRHNGGSVWVDSLGWPWPKHECFEDETASSGLYDYFAKNEYLNDENTVTGIVMSSKRISQTDKVPSKIILEIESIEFKYSLPIPGNTLAKSLNHNLVLLNLEKNKIVFSNYWKTNILDKILEERKIINMCEFCGKKFTHPIDMDIHISKTHGNLQWEKHLSNTNVKKRLVDYKRCEKCHTLVKNINMKKHLKKHIKEEQNMTIGSSVETKQDIKNKKHKT